MKKKIFVLAVLLLAMMLCFAGCAHKHTFSTEWSHDENGHFHSATCGHDVFADEEEHTFGEEKIIAAATCTVNGIK